MARRYHRYHRYHKYHKPISSTYYNPGYTQRPWSIKLPEAFKDITLPIKAVVITIIILILSIPQIHLLSLGGVVELSTLFTSSTLFINFVIIFAVLLVYDFVTSRVAHFYQEVFGSLFGSIFITLAKGTLSFPIMLILTAIIFYLGFMSGKLLNLTNINERSRKLISGTIGILVFFWLIAVIFVYYSYLVPASPISLNSVYLTQSQLNNSLGTNSTSGIGLYSVNRLNANETTYGSLVHLFPTPIQLVAFNLTFANTQAGSAYFVEYYNITSLNLTEYVLQTPQASIIFITQAHSTNSIGNINGLQYFTKDNVIMASKGNYIAFITCSGALCTNANIHRLLQAVSQDFGG